MSEESLPASTQSPSRASQSPQNKSRHQTGSSSSSSAPSGSQASSGSGTLSSVDTLPVTLPSVPEEPEPQPWGRLLPMARGFRAHDCVEEEYLFGRDSKCHYVLDDPDERGSKRFRIYSKKHFRIFREDGEVFIQDFSNNGTFVDGLKIGKDKKLPLVNNAVLALSEVKNRGEVTLATSRCRVWRTLFISLQCSSSSTCPRRMSPCCRPACKRSTC